MTKRSNMERVRRERSLPPILLLPLSSSHFFFPRGGGGSGPVPEPGGQRQLRIPWPACLAFGTLARRSGQSEVLRGQPAVVLNSSQIFLPLREKTNPEDSQDFCGCLRDPCEPWTLRATLRSRAGCAVASHISCSCRLGASKVDDDGPLKDRVPPLHIRDGHHEHCPRRLSGVVIRSAACGLDGCMIRHNHSTCSERIRTSAL